MAFASEEDFRGTARFAVRRRLGAGAYGVVYEAFDRERESLVALKSLRPGNVEALYRLKREFRSLADIAHPNLATLHEMLADGDDWFITMELVRGVNFLEYIRSRPGASEATRLDPTVSETTPDAVSVAPGGPPATAAPFDESRLRAALRQAVSGVAALHDAGKLHRDIKPSNVLVTPEGRVVMLDFGLVTEFDTLGEDRSLSLVGTPAYMAPELGSRTGVSESSDWYSLGVMLYEALTGRQPFSGSFTEMMWEKNRGDPPPPRRLVPEVPDDLDELCRGLLRRNPSDRPVGRDILRRLGAAHSTAVALPEAGSLSLRPGRFVGRTAELAALRKAFETSRRGAAVRVDVHGSSGIGKSALVRRFLEDLRKEDAVVLSGRCYERESTPFKALDSLIDSLSQYLKRLPSSEAEALLPADILALTRVFPVLRRVEAVAATRRKVVEIADSFELRRRAFAALRELFVRLAGSRDVVLFIDDLQWGDTDSAALLEELVRPPDSPTLLLIVSYRSEEAATSPPLKRLLAGPEAAEVRHLAVEELTPSDARELAAALLESNPSALSSRIEEIARESAGNPFFIDELIRFGRLGAETTLDAMVRARVRLLPEPARRLMEIVAVAGQPLDVEAANVAAAVGVETGAISVLRVGRLVRLRAAGDRPEVEPYHDRIREAVVAQIPPETLKDHHRRLAVALEAAGRADPEGLSLHFREAGDGVRAADYAAKAADRAAETLAFDRAARLYRMALEADASSEAGARRSLGVRLGDALANAGRGAEAARAYLAAAEGASRAETLELERRAAGHLLRSGHIDEALPLFERVTGRVGLTLVQPSWRTMLQLLLGRALIRIRGVGFRERDASQIPAEDLIRLDTYWTLSTVLTLVNSIRGKEFQNRLLLLALRLGEPYRVTIAIAIESGYAALAGSRQKKRSAKLVRTAMALADRVKLPHAMGLAHLGALAVAYLEGRWQECWRQAEIAEAIMRERCTGVFWELDFTHILSLRALYYLGETKELVRRLPTLIREALERDNLLGVASLRVRHSYVTDLVADQPEEARENLRRMVEAWSRKSFNNQHYWALIAGGDSALYAQDSKAAWNLVAEQWPSFKRSGLRHLQLYRIESWQLRARSALARIAEGSCSTLEGEKLVRLAARDARRIERESTPWGWALARLVRAGIAAERRDSEETAHLLASAEKEFARLDMALYAAAARRRRGQLLGGQEGAALVAGVDAWMAGQDIKNPARMADMLAPGRWS